MNCSCCGRRKKLFESFETITHDINVCVECSTLLYKLRDCKNEKNEKESDKCLKLIKKRMSNKSSKKFEEWFKEFSK